jgi:hypothetical protein
MIDKKLLEKFLLEARTKTYAGDSQKSESLLPNSVQYDYQDAVIFLIETFTILATAYSQVWRQSILKARLFGLCLILVTFLK